MQLTEGENSTAFLVASIIGILLLIVFSALFSASENAFFSINKKDKADLVSSNSKGDKAVLDQLAKPKELLATILIANNFVNVTLVILSSILFTTYVHLIAPWDFVIQVVLVTFILLLFGEVIPKVYATQNNIKIARFMSGPIKVTKKLLFPLIYLLVKSTNGINNRIKKINQSVSLEELNQAIDITTEEGSLEEEKGILKGIVNYGNMSASQIMTSRMDIIALDSQLSYSDILSIVRESGHSRLPVFREKIDEITGVVYVKDLLGYLNEGADFEWGKLTQEVMFVPENKKIDDLLDN